jgi:hypothetical protein
MSKRRGDWRDLLTTYAVALKPNKICVGYVAVVMSLVVLVVATFVYALLVQGGVIKPAGLWVGTPVTRGVDVFSALGNDWARGGPLGLIAAFVPLLDPFFGASRGHFVISVLTYVLLFWVWSGAGGMISRLTALEYARDDLPTLADARQMVRSKRTAYWLAPVWPLVFFVALVFLNFLGGIVASIPYAGPILLICPGYPLLFITTALIVMLIFFGVLSFGLMMPAVSVGGKDALDGWSTSYTYVLWGSARYIGYTALAGAIGLVSYLVFSRLTLLFLSSLTGSVNLGYLYSTGWSAFYGNMWVGTTGGYYGAVQYIMGVLLGAVTFLPVAYAVSFFFSAFTIIFFLLRKHVDNIEIEELYEESEEEEEQFQPEEPSAPEAPASPEGAASPEAAAEEAAEAEVPPEVAEEGKPEPTDAGTELPKEPEIDKDKSMED